VTQDLPQYASQLAFVNLCNTDDCNTAPMPPPAPGAPMPPPGIGGLAGLKAAEASGGMEGGVANPAARRQLLQVVTPPVQLLKTSLPLQQLSQPVYGPCASVSAAIGKTVSGGSWSGRMQCEGIDTVFMVGDAGGTSGRSLACYNMNGNLCSYPGQAGCGDCMYPSPTASNWACWSTGNFWTPFQCGFRDEYASWQGGGPGAGYCLVRAGHGMLRRARAMCADERSCVWCVLAGLPAAAEASSDPEASRGPVQQRVWQPLPPRGPAAADGHQQDGRRHLRRLCRHLPGGRQQQQRRLIRMLR
jgi:hypothetical protein